MSLHKCDCEEEIKNIMAAFPDGVENHRRAHEAMIEAKRAEAKFWAELRLEVAKKGILGLIIILLGLVATGNITGLIRSLGWLHTP